MTSASTLKKIDTASLHWIPCNIDHDGPAPVQVYFHPEEITQLQPQQDEKIETKDHEPTSCASPSSVFAASFRGRGLLASCRKNLPKDVIGTVLFQSSEDNGDESGPDSGNDKMSSGEQFNSVLEWEHEWNEKSLLANSSSKNVDLNSESSVDRSLALMQLLRSVHDPLPVEE